MKRRTFFGWATGSLATFFLARTVTAGEKLSPGDEESKPQIAVQTHPLAVSRTTEKPKHHG